MIIMIMSDNTSSCQVTEYDMLAGRFLSFSPAVHSAAHKIVAKKGLTKLVIY